MTQTEGIYHEALVGMIARWHERVFKAFTPVHPSDVLPREAFTADDEWLQWLNEVGPDVISRAPELVNEGHITSAHPGP